MLQALISFLHTVNTGTIPSFCDFFRMLNHLACTTVIAVNSPEIEKKAKKYSINKKNTY